MKYFKHLVLAMIVAAFALQPADVCAASAREISAKAHAALLDLYKSNPKARIIGEHASAVLVFPNIVKGGFVVAGQHGEGALMTDAGTIGYYSSLAASYGFQAGVQKFGYALFFMNKRAMKYLRARGGWELGSAPSLVIVDQGVSKSLSTTSLKKDIYAFFFNQKGLMGGLGLQGSKISEIHPR